MLLRAFCGLGAPAGPGGGPLYGTDDFRAASELITLAGTRGWPRALLGALTGGRRSARAVWTVVKLPLVTLAVSPPEQRAWLTDPFPPAARSIFEGCIGQAVLALDEDDDEYLLGHHKRQLRTRIRGAERDGVHTMVLEDFDEWFDLARDVFESRPQGPEELALMRAPDPSQRMGYFAAVDALGSPAALGAVAIFGQVAVVFSLVSHPSHPAAGEARYLLHTSMRSDLRKRGIAYMTAGRGLRLPAGLQLFQNLLGYEVCNLHIVVA